MVELTRRYQHRGEGVAYDTVLGREVALHRVDAEDLVEANRFEREMELTARLQHPSVIQVYDAGLLPDGSRYFATQRVEGETLDVVVEHAKTFDARMELVPSIRRACEAVAHAHGLSIVHGNLVPENILIGPFGETLVLGWGRLDADESGDPRADVLGLGKVLEGLIAGVEAPTQRELLSDFGAIVRRATSVALDARYPDASRLCDDLRRFEAGQTVSARDYGLRSRARRFVGRHRRAIALSGSFVALGGLAGVGVASLMRTEGRERCTGASEALAGVWGDARREEVRDAFGAVDKPYAAAAWTRTEAALEAYVDDWMGMHTSACESTAQGSQSSELLDLRMACLDRAAIDLGATVDVLAAADASVVEKADALVGALRPLARCESREALEADVEPPSVDEAEAVDAARTELARVDSLRRAARYAAAGDALEAARDLLQEVGYAPVSTELALVEGLLAGALGEYESAEQRLEEAIKLGTQWGQWDEVRRASDAMMHVLAAKQLNPTAALQYRAVAEGLAKGDAIAEAELHSRLATVFNTAGKYQEAVEQHEAALAIRVSLGDPVALATSRNNYGVALKNSGSLEAAEVELREAIRARVETVGPDHPDTAMSRSNLATVLDALGKPEESEVEARKALRIQQRVLPSGHNDIAASRVHLGHALFSQGKYADAEAEYREGLAGLDPEHPHVGSARHSLGNTLIAQKRYAEAAAEYRTALDVYVAALGSDHPRVETVRLGIGNALFVQREYAEAEVEYRALLESRSKRTPVNPTKLATAHSSLSNALLRQGEHDEAARHLESALTLYVENLEPEHPDITRTRHNLANVLFEAGRTAEALPFAEQAWASRKDDDGPAEKRAGTAFLLARISWKAGGGKARARARALAQEAKTGYAQAGEAYAEGIATVEAWLKAR